MAAPRDEFIPTRHSLISRLKDWDDQESWKEFFDTYWKLLYSVALKSGLSDAEAQDVVQDTIVAVAKKMPEFHYDPALGSFKSWLLTITRRRIIDHLRKRQRQPQRHERRPDATEGRTGTMDKIPDPAGDQFGNIWEEEWKDSLYAAAVKRVKQQVEAKQFQMFDCYAVKGWPVEKVAGLLGVSVGAIYTAKSRITALIKEEIGRLEARMV